MVRRQFAAVDLSAYCLLRDAELLRDRSDAQEALFKFGALVRFDWPLLPGVCDQEWKY